MKTYRSPLGKAKGLGSAKEGSNDFSTQHFLAIILVPLALWFVTALCGLAANADYATAMDFFSSPINLTFTILFLVASLFHSIIGLKMVITDYIHSAIRRDISLYIIKAACIFAMAIGILSLLTVYFKG